MANKFKNGDILRVKDRDGLLKWMRTRNFPEERFLSQEFKVDNITEWTWTEGFKSESFSNQNSQIYGGYMPEEFFELATAEQPINTYGFKIGDVIGGNILNKWCKAGKNEYSKHLKEWKVQTAPWGVKNHTISEFTVCPDGITGFKIGADNSIYIRAEGFVQFCEEYRRSKSVFPIEQLERRVDELRKLGDYNPPDDAFTRFATVGMLPAQSVGRHTRRDNFRPTVHTEDEVVVKIDFNDKSYLNDPLNRTFDIKVNPEEDDLPF